MNPEISWIGSGISIDKESQLGAVNRTVSIPVSHMPFVGTNMGIVIGDAVETPVTKIKPTPVVGHTCLIRHQVKRSANGDVLGLQRADGKGQRVTITAVYLDGQVRTGNSDVWEVQPAGLNTWETINPKHGKSE